MPWKTPSDVVSVSQCVLTNSQRGIARPRLGDEAGDQRRGVLRADVGRNRKLQRPLDERGIAEPRQRVEEAVALLPVCRRASGAAPCSGRRAMASPPTAATLQHRRRQRRCDPSRERRYCSAQARAPAAASSAELAVTPDEHQQRRALTLTVVRIGRVAGQAKRHELRRGSGGALIPRSAVTSPGCTHVVVRVGDASGNLLDDRRRFVAGERRSDVEIDADVVTPRTH